MNIRTDSNSNQITLQYVHLDNTSGNLQLQSINPTNNNVNTMMLTSDGNILVNNKKIPN